jgi:hypothetical protein
VVTADLVGLNADARYRRERLDLYRAKAYGSGLVTATGLRERERECQYAEDRLRQARREAAAEMQG